MVSLENFKSPVLGSNTKSSRQELIEIINPIKRRKMILRMGMIIWVNVSNNLKN
jgi:hypothetical protein